MGQMEFLSTGWELLLIHPTTRMLTKHIIILLIKNHTFGMVFYGTFLPKTALKAHKDHRVKPDYKVHKERKEYKANKELRVLTASLFTGLAHSVLNLKRPLSITPTTILLTKNLTYGMVLHGRYL